MLEDGNPDFSVVYRTIPTSNHNVIGYETREVQVVYRTIPTSNHNVANIGIIKQVVVYRTIPTSNHNNIQEAAIILGLYIVLFLHQTTTTCHQTQLPHRCISYYSYIKPQRSVVNRD